MWAMLIYTLFLDWQWKIDNTASSCIPSPIKFQLLKATEAGMKSDATVCMMKREWEHDMAASVVLAVWQCYPGLTLCFNPWA